MVAKKDMADFIPVDRYYANLRKMRNSMLMIGAVMTILVGFMMYLAGYKSGDTDVRLKYAIHANKTQTEVYNADREVMASLPDHRDIGAWAKWMRKQRPFFNR